MSEAALVGEDATAGPAPGTPPEVARGVLVITVLVSAVAALGVVPPTLSVVVAALVVAVVGIPHGSVDHLVSERTASSPPSRPVFVAWYLAAMAAVGAVWAIAPSLALAAFLAMSVHHFGQSDLARLRIRGRGRRLSVYWSRGLLLVAVPLVAHVDDVAPTIRTLTGRDLTDSTLLGESRWAIVGTLIAVHLLAIVVVGDRRVRRREVATTLVLSTLFAVADPLLGFAVYFGLWHSLGHVYVIADRLGFVERPLRSVARLAIPLSAVSLAGLVVLAAALLATDRSDLIVPAAIVAVSMLTLPHMVVVEQMWSDRGSPVSRADRRERARTRR